MILLAIAIAAQEGRSVNNHRNNARIRSQLFDANLGEGGKFSEYNGDAGLLVLIPPFSNGTDGTYVEMQLVVFKIESLTSAAGHLNIKVWFRLKWSDLRLAWDPNYFGGLRSIQVRAAHTTDAEGTDIWTPDIVPYNSDEPLVQTLDPALATVDSTGSVYWARAGSLKLLCAFSGLNNFPFDVLRCPTDFGSWSFDNNVQRIGPLGGKYIETHISERSGGTTYAEWEVLDSSEDSVKQVLRSYEPSLAGGEEVWPVVELILTLRRDAFVFYMTQLWLPPIFLAILSLSTFFLSPEVGERLGYGITILLAAQFGKAVQQQLLPICREVLWIDIYLIYHEVFYFTVLVSQTADQETPYNVVHIPQTKLCVVDLVYTHDMHGMAHMAQVMSCISIFFYHTESENLFPGDPGPHTLSPPNFPSLQLPSSLQPPSSSLSTSLPPAPCRPASFRPAPCPLSPCLLPSAFCPLPPAALHPAALSPALSDAFDPDVENLARGRMLHSPSHPVPPHPTPPPLGWVWSLLGYDAFAFILAVDEEEDDERESAVSSMYRALKLRHEESERSPPPLWAAKLDRASSAIQRAQRARKVAEAKKATRILHPKPPAESPPSAAESPRTPFRAMAAHLRPRPAESPAGMPSPTNSKNPIVNESRLSDNRH